MTLNAIAFCLLKGKDESVDVLCPLAAYENVF